MSDLSTKAREDMKRAVAGDALGIVERLLELLKWEEEMSALHLAERDAARAERNAAQREAQRCRTICDEARNERDAALEHAAKPQVCKSCGAEQLQEATA